MIAVPRTKSADGVRSKLGRQGDIDGLPINPTGSVLLEAGSSVVTDGRVSAREASKAVMSR